MRYFFSRHCTAELLLLALPWTVLSCEDKCMTGTTNAFIHRYSNPVLSTMQDMNAMIISDILPNQRNASQDMLPSLGYMAGIFSAWHENAPARMKEDIFPHYFHGKCQSDFYDRNGSLVHNEDPPGCPNPDCPVVCGTPGSLVHFFNTLVNIAFNSTEALLQELITSDSTEFKALATEVARRRNPPTRRSPKFAPRKGSSSDGDNSLADLKVVQKLEEIMRQLQSRLEYHCGGSGTGKTDGLKACRWEKEMKAYILTFP